MVALLHVGMSMAQNEFVASLQHGNDISHYYGQGALQAAYSASQNGDVITLSAGRFTFSGTFDKGITIRGAGIDAEMRTYISDEFEIQADDNSLSMELEGIWFNNYVYLVNSTKGNGQLKVIKCGFDNLRIWPTKNNNYNAYGLGTGPISRFYNCIINAMDFVQNTNPNCNFVNSYIRALEGSRYLGNNNSAFVNCVVDGSYRNGYGSRPSSYFYLNFRNCIFYIDDNYNGYALPSTATAYNCLGIGNEYLFQNLYANSTNQLANGIETIFATYKGTYEKGEAFKLTEQAKTQYLGSDGTQVGMQGGMYPYSSTVQYPVITKLETDAHTTKEGVLNVKVQIDGK